VKKSKTPPGGAHKLNDSSFSFSNLRKKNNGYNENYKRRKLMEDIVVVAKSAAPMPVKHQLGQLLFGTIVGWGASKLAEKAYVAGLKALQNRKTTVK